MGGGRGPTPRDRRPRPSPCIPRRPARQVGGLRQLYGSAWQWTSSAYLPYPGFRPAPGAVGEYNGKFMVNQQVLRGSAAITPPGHARLTYRNFFPPGGPLGHDRRAPGPQRSTSRRRPPAAEASVGHRTTAQRGRAAATWSGDGGPGIRLGRGGTKPKVLLRPQYSLPAATLS